ERQSIFSFQGALPHKSDEMQREFAGAFGAVGMKWQSVRLEHSFRSGPNVLDAVVNVFAMRDVAASVTTDAAGIAPHLALPDAIPGLVEIWPLLKAESRREVEGWDAPFDALAEIDPRVRLARNVADRIASDIGTGVPVGRKRQPMTAGDVLVLVRPPAPPFDATIP